MKTSLNELLTKKINESERYDDVEITIKCTKSSAEECILSLIERLKRWGNPGHSFEIVVEPDQTKENGKRNFFFDGDGSHKIHEIKIDGENYTPDKKTETFLRGKK